MRVLSSDRDRLLARVTVLERNLEDITGSVGRIGNAQSTAAQSSPLPLLDVLQGPSVIASLSAPRTIGSFPADRADGPAAHASGLGPESTGTSTDFGVDIGGGPTIESLRDLWIRGQGQSRKRL